MFSHIVAASLNNCIGKNGKIPWHLSSDLKRFKKLTQHKTILMGRKTYTSIPGPLLNRFNIVISRTMVKFSDKTIDSFKDHPNYPKSSENKELFKKMANELWLNTVKNEGIQIVESVEESLQICDPNEENFIIGGEQIYRQTMDKVNKIYMTRVKQVIQDGDTFYPEIPSDFTLKTEEDFPDFSFCLYEKTPEKS